MYQKDQSSRGKYRFNMAVLIMLIFAVMAAGGVWMLTRATAADTDAQDVQKVIYVTVDGGTSPKDGKSWATAVGAASLDWAVQQSAASRYQATHVEVWVKSGVYTRTATLSLDKGAKLYGGFAGNETTEASRDARDIATNETTLDGQQKEKFYIVTSGADANSDDTRIDGFTITGSNGKGGMYNISSPTVTNCTFSGNTAWNGGGMYNNGSSSGGDLYNSSCRPIVTNCTFSGNTANDGGGMYNDGSKPTITNCTFSGNSATNSSDESLNFNSSGGAMYNYGYSSLTITNCTFSGNTATKTAGAVAVCPCSDIKIINSSFSDNAANHGGGAIGNEGTLQIINCTFSGNKANDVFDNSNNGAGYSDESRGGGAIKTANSNALANPPSSTTIVVNSIFWGNSATASTDIKEQEIRNFQGTLIIQNCIVSGDLNLASDSSSSKDIISGDPMIISVDKDMNATTSSADFYMFTISGDSSALGRGLYVGTNVINGTSVDVPPTDQCGRGRFKDRVDIGAYQYNATVAVDRVSLTSAEITLHVGEKTTLTATVSPEDATYQTVTWTTSNAETASVADNGTVTAHKVGTAVITATTDDRGKTAACTVTVSAANEKEAAKPATPPAKPENAPDNVTATSGPVEVIYIQPGATDEEKENAITEAAGKLEGITSKDLEATGSTVKIKEDLAKKLAEGILGKELSKDTVVPLPVFTAVCGAADGKVLMAAFEMTGSSFLADKPENAQFLKILSGDTAEFLGYVSKAEDFADGKFTVMTMDDAIFTGEFAADTTYKLVVFIKDGGKYDMDAGSERNEDGSKKPNGRIADPLAIIKTGASPTPTPNHNGGSGCNSGAFGSGMALLALCLPMLIKRRKR